MSLKASTSSREFESNNIDIDEAFSTEQTFSESQERNSAVEAITLLGATSETLTPPPVGDDSSRADPSADPQSLQI
ncbi:hypothetical protein WN944_029287 [Citrus x changshan-huyou]|uniref:Uncharacterized protein n=1 Tax=Citrus x changshan-huyou TaxID=2935761 RepID=A0AAP0LM18_9ROSI